MKYKSSNKLSSRGVTHTPSPRSAFMRGIKSFLFRPISRIKALRDDEAGKAIEIPHCNPRGRHYSQAFTLIELLVVVLIIGILSAIALPQYEKAVEKARATEALNTLMTAVKACKVYYLANGEYPTKFEDLDIQMPGEHKSYPSSSYIDFFETKNWRVALHGKGDIYNEMVAIFRLTGPYKGAAFHYAFNPNGWIEKDQIICSEIGGNGFSAPRDSYCKKIMGGTPDPGPSNSNYFYKLP